MKNSVILLLIILIFLTECQRTKLTKTHGISYLDKREKLIIVNKSNKNDAIKVLGQPATKGMNDDNLWIYIERTITRGKTLKLGRSVLSKNNVLVLEFDKYGVLNNKTFYDKKNIKDIKFAEAITENDIRRENFVYSFLSSVRQKMEQGRK
jgi:outer membrane protein assembly factor BamE (lipoprotein component of BamABCDE complex)|tara:strand:- start:216 stop:668 length:453 start_codon:yes stop_codon:yes gene_type:complete